MKQYLKKTIFISIYILLAIPGFAIIEPNIELFNNEDSICESELYKSRIAKLDLTTPMDFQYNEFVHEKIIKYLTKEKRLISKMLSLKRYYFPIFEEKLDKYNLPLELKYLSIIESALNPRARSKSGATGLWQFMYTTGKQYNLNVTSYTDERSNPHKSTEAACEYFLALYIIFGDWNLVLAAYNGGPGYIQRKIIKTNKNDYWELRPYLRAETQNYIPLFIAINYVMSYHKEHEIEPSNLIFYSKETDTLILKKQVSFDVLSELICVPKEEIIYLNPQFKREVFPKENIAIIPKESKTDFLLNETNYYSFIEAVKNKEILVGEERVEYYVNNGDYLGKIALEYDVFVHEIKSWNNLNSSNISIGQKLILYVKIKDSEDLKKEKEKEYIIQKGDTLWEIAQKHKGISISKIKEYNSLDSDNLTPGTRILLPIR